jgi:hypothetical protein
MNINIITPETEPPCYRAWAISMVIKAFKGRRDVEIHLFRGEWDPEEEEAYDWDALVGSIDDVSPETAEQIDPTSNRRVVLEAFTDEERDEIIDFIRTQYHDRVSEVTAMPLIFPVPPGLTPLSDVTPDKSVGLLDFRKIPAFKADIPLLGLYDLSQHKPIIEETSD